MTMEPRSLLLLVFSFLVGSVFAQPELLMEANQAYRDGDLAKAKQLLDKAVKSEAFSAMPEAWVLRGFVYKDLYKAEQGVTQSDQLRDEALASLYLGNQADASGQYRFNVMQAFDYLTRTMNNDAARALNSQDHERGLAMYAKYKEATLRMEPKTDFTARDIEFYNALGTVYSKNHRHDREDTVWFNKAVTAFRRVLDVDPENYGANFNLATLYYNVGVAKIKAISADNDIPSLKQIQEVSREIFRQALPYMKKAHDLNPKRKETILGLESIHYSLQDVEKSDHYRHLYEEIEQDPLRAPENK